MMLPQPQPSDLYEVTIAVPSAAGYSGTVNVNGWRLVSNVTGVSYYAIDGTIVTAADGTFAPTFTASAFGVAGLLTVGSLATVHDNTGLMLTNNIPITACVLSPYTEYARQLAQVLGTAYQPADGSFIADDLRTLGKGLYDADATLTRAINEAFPDTAVDMLTEWETRLGLPVDTTLAVATRQANLLAKYRAVFGSSVQRMNAAIQTIDATAQLVEWSIMQIYANEPSAWIWAASTRRLVVQFNVTVSAATFDNPAVKARIAALVEQMKPAHTGYVIVTSTAGFKWAVGKWGREAWGN